MSIYPNSDMIWMLKQMKLNHKFMLATSKKNLVFKLVEIKDVQEFGGEEICYLHIGEKEDK